MSVATENKDEQQFTDLSDPLAFLSALQQSTAPSSPPGSSSHESSSASGDSPPDWSQFSTLWDSTFADPDLDAQVQPSAPAPGTVKPATADLFNFMPMDLDSFDFNAQSVDPSAIQFGLGMSSQDFFDPSAFSQQPRRLSVTSSSSSSGASLSPSLDFSSSPSSNTSMTGMQPPVPAAEPPMPINVNDPIALLAHQARQSAGVTLAVPTNSMSQAGKLPIPRLRPGTSPTSTAPSSSFPSPQATPAPSTAAPELPPLAPGARTKTSHTTIERRYRTNLNTRIQGLKDAVPALRVLERRKAAEKAGQAFTEEPADLLDARGFADGVKVARKVSKANVLGKAAEYIRVLKRREARLEREKDGLRELIQGLVGGQALLREFEAGWAAKYGGKERDELEYEGLGEDDEDDEDDEDEDDGGRARKRPRVEKKAAAAPAKPAEQPEKRKRGRPRKEQPAPVVAAPVPPPVVPVAQPAPGTQYLLAAFAFFSFFNMPGRTPTPSHHGHTGTVFTSAPGPSHPATQAVFGMEWHDLVGAFHLLVSALVFASIVMPWLPTIMKSLHVPSALRRPSFTRKLSETSTTLIQQDPFPRLDLVDALSPTARGAPDEAAQLRAALRIWPGITGVIVRVVGKISRGRRADRGIERLQLEQRAWMRLGEVIALDGTASFGNRVQAYLGAMSHMPAFSPQPSDLATLALLALPLSPARAEGLWQKAAATRVVRPAERRALERLDVRAAAAALKSTRAANLAKQGASPLQALGVLAARDDIRVAAAKLFVHAVSPASASTAVDAERDVRETVLSARALGGHTARLATLLDALARGTAVPADAADALGDGPEAAVLAALVRVRALFPSTIAGGEVQVVLSPAAGESAGKMRALLRRTLGHEAFEEPGLEEARDRVVDMICEGETSERRKGRRA